MSKKEKQEKPEKQEDTKYQDMYMRVTADFQNYKRRVEKERLVWIRESQSDVVEKLLPVLDELELALKACEKQGENQVLSGLKLTYKNTHKTFTDLGLKEIDCSGKFDPEFHEALVQVDSEDHESGDIVDVLNKGYIFHDHVVRHAKVSVAK